MNKPLIFSLITGFGVLSAMGQASINGNNAGSTLLEVQDPAINGGVFVAVGKDAANDGFLGAGPGQVTISMYAAANGTPLATLEAGTPVAIIPNSPSALVNASGTFSFGNPMVLPNVPGLFDGSSQIEVVLFGITTLSGGKQYSGYSSEATGITPSTGSANPAPIFGSTSGLINTFDLTPVKTVVNQVPDQSSTMALGGLSAIAILFFGRRK